MNLADPDLELVDPTPNVHTMFLQFDQTFFETKLASRAVVRWSKRMYSCAGVCSYEGRGGLCDIALSEPLLKLRPRKDLVETLLHEMIHAFLFITCRDQDRDGHGPNFKAHMYRINSAAGLNISIYHDFHDEVKLYQTHWWRCDGPCQMRRPHFGIVRRTANRAPGPSDYWWSDHKRKCGGTFIKFKEPETTRKKAVPAKPKGDITKFVTTTKKTAVPVGEPMIITNGNKRPSLTKSNSVVAVKKGVKTINTPNFVPPAVFTGKGHMIPGSRERSSSVDVVEAVRNKWANKQLTPNPSVAAYITARMTAMAGQLSTIHKVNTDVKLQNKGPLNSSKTNIGLKAIKHKADSVHTESPPVKIKKIDDYFKTTATSLLKDIYGDNIEITESNNTNKFVAVQTGASNSKVVQVDCPICKLKIDESAINQHLDECLNKDMISQLCTSSDEISQPYAKPQRPCQNEPRAKVEPSVKLEPVKDKILVKQSLKDIIQNLSSIPPYKGKPDDVDSLNYTVMRKDLDRSITTFRGTFRGNTIHGNAVVKEPKNLDDNLNWEDVLGHEEPKEFDPKVVENVKSVVKKIDFDRHLRKSDNFVVKEEIDLTSGFLPSFISDEAKTIKLPPVKLEPGTDVITSLNEQKCPCCGNRVTKSIEEHLDECLAFFVNSQEPEEGASTSFANQTIVIDDDDDIFDESQALNATGTKLPCPCCLKMVENDDMNSHLDSCLS